MSGRAATVAAARESIARGSKSFALASTLFDQVTRERAWLLYFWCRTCDDIADGQNHGGAMSQVDDALARIDRMAAQTDTALSGTVTDEAAFDALRIVAQETGIPHDLPIDVIQGFRLDADGWQPQTEQDLLNYCYHVAGAVGRMMAIVMGVAPGDGDTLDRATDLGLAFQLANIARDVAEDAAAGRCYVPRDWMDEAGIGRGEIIRDRAKLAVIGSRLATMAARYEASARVGATHLPLRSRWAVLAAAGIYGDIAREVARRGEMAWDTRVITTKVAKAGWVARAFAQALVNRPSPVARQGLWTHTQSSS